MRRRFAVLGLAVLVFAAAAPSGASAAGSPGLARIVRPHVDQVVGNGKLRVVLRTRVGLDQLRVTVSGRDVKRHLRRTARGYRGVVPLRRRGLRSGVHELVVFSRGSADFDRTRFIVARRNPRLLTMRPLRVRGGEAPARVVVTPGRRTRLQAWLNGRRVEHAFQPQGHRLVGRLGANDHVRPGRNRLVVLAHRTAHHGRHSAYDVASRTFWHPRGRVIAGAGRDRFVTAGGFVALRGSATRDGSPAARPARAVRHRWSVAAAPRGARATLTRAGSASPEFLPTTPGSYRIRTRVTAPNGSTSVDTASVTVRADVPPLGWRLDTTDDRGTITVDGEAVAGTTWPCASGSDAACPSYVSWAIYNRQTLKLESSGNRPGDAAGIKALADMVQATYSRSPYYLAVVNLSGASAALPDGVRLLKQLGVDTEQPRAALARPISVVGVPGSPAGSAFISDPRLQCAFSNPACPTTQPQSQANMAGYLRFNDDLTSLSGYFEFVFADQKPFATDVAPDDSMVTMKVGDATYQRSTPAGSSGFVLALLNSNTLQLNRPLQLIVTNNPDRTERPDDEVLMADLLTFASVPYNGRGELLVMLQAFGTPRGRDGAWLRAARAVERLGGNAQLFAQLNQGNPDQPNQGRYAFVGRAMMDTGAAESSQSLTGREGDGRLAGILGRGRDAQFQPLLADPAGTVNADLVAIVNRPTTEPNRGFGEAFTDAQAKAAEYLGRDIRAIGVCPQTGPCDVRRAYYEQYSQDWVTIHTNLRTDDVCRPPAGGFDGFSPEDCNAVRERFYDEIGMRNRVETYFGPTKGLQASFSVANVATKALVDVSQISSEIVKELPSQTGHNGTSDVFGVLANVAAVAGISKLVCPECGTVAGALGGAFSIGAYLTKQEGVPDVVGPKVTREGVKLGGELFDRYQRVSAYFTTEAKIVMSDGSKLREVATRSATDPDWRLDPNRAAAQMQIGTRQAIYKALVPVAYPTLYDLGPMTRPQSQRNFANAREWQCFGYFTSNRRLFQKTGDGAQLKWTTTTADSYLGQTHLIAVGGERTVGSGTDAYVPAPPDALTGKLFKNQDAPTNDGIGLYRLEFYSPRYFTLHPKLLRMDDQDGFYRCDRMPNPPGGG